MKGRILLFCNLVFILHCFSQQVINYQVILRSNVGSINLWDGNNIRIYGFAPTLGAVPTLPGATLYCNEGDTVIIDAKSISQNDHHTIHLHGLDVDTRNDGDPATSFYLSHLQDTTYTFVGTHAGTYIYHCHVADVIHVQMGMYGLIVVHAANGVKTAWTSGPAFNKEYKWLMSDIDKSWHDTIPYHDPIMDTVHVPKYVPDYFLINGVSHQYLNNDSLKISGSVGEKIYLRLANIGFFNNQIIFPSSLNAVIIDSDGRPLPNSITSDTVEVMPGERYGVMLTPSAQITDSIIVNFLSMNTDSVYGTEYPPVVINGFFSVKKNIQDSPITIYPNPTKGSFTVSGAKDAGIEIFDVLGQLLVKNEIQTAAFPIDMSGYPKGVFIIKISQSTGVFTTRLVTY